MISAAEALERLRVGNRRFVEGLHDSAASVRPADLVGGQEPFAVILGCSDSRVPAELVFDQGLGDLFVIRVAGNVLAPVELGSVELAAGTFRTRLVVVLGHTGCSAVRATLQEILRPDARVSPNLRAIVDRVRPRVQTLMESDSCPRGEALVDAAVRANIRCSVEGLRHDSPVLERLIAEEGLEVVGAEYSLETGAVEFLDPEGT